MHGAECYAAAMMYMRALDELFDGSCSVAECCAQLAEFISESSITNRTS
jgi:hypothetical protein